MHAWLDTAMLYYLFFLFSWPAPGAVHDLMVTVNSVTSATITWHPPTALNGIIIKYSMTIRNLKMGRSDYNISLTLQPDEDLTRSFPGLGEGEREGEREAGSEGEIKE